MSTNAPSPGLAHSLPERWRTGVQGAHLFVFTPVTPTPLQKRQEAESFSPEVSHPWNDKAVLFNPTLMRFIRLHDCAMSTSSDEMRTGYHTRISATSFQEAVRCCLSRPGHGAKST